jgi:predicted Rdx family selenoprotein
LQASIKSRYGISAQLREGIGGIFEVSVDGNTIYTNRTTYRFPSDEEIFEQIDALRA